MAESRSTDGTISRQPNLFHSAQIHSKIIL